MQQSAKDIVSRGTTRSALRLVLIGLAYFVASYGGLRLSLQSEGIASIWWAGGVALAALLMTGRREWPAILGVVFAANALANLFIGNSLLISAGFALANTLEPALAGLIMTGSRRIRSLDIRRWTFNNLIELHWLAVGAALSCALAGLLGAAVVVFANGASYTQMLKIWWVEGTLGILLVTPLILCWGNREKQEPGKSLLWWLEIIALLAALAAATWSIFGNNHKLNQIVQQPYMLFPFLLWAALRLGQSGLTLTIFVLSCIVLGTTSLGIGSFPLGGETKLDRIIYAQLFLSISIITNMTLAAVLGERKRAEDTLRISEGRYRAIVHTTRDGFYMANWHGSLLEVNDAYCQMTGFSRDELLRKNIRELDAVLSDKDMEPLVKETFVKGTIFYETKHLRKNGGPVDVEVSSNYMHFDNGRFFTFVRDITRRKDGERALYESQARWQLMVEGTGDGMWDWNPQSRQVFYSAQWKAMLGYAEGEIDNTLEEWESRIHPDDKPRVFADIEKHFRGQTPTYMSEYRLRCKDGQYRWILVRGKVIDWSADGLPLRVIGSHSDINEWKRLTESSLRNEQVLRLFVAHTPAAIAMFDRNMCYLAHSRRYLLDYHLLEQEIIGKCHYDIFPEIPERWKEIHRRCLAGEVQHCDEDPFPRADGSIDWVKWEILPWYEADGSIGGILLFSEVITEEKVAKDRLRQSELNLEKSQEVAHIGSWTWDTLTGRVAYSDEMYRIFGLDPASFGGDINDAIQRAVHPEDQQLVFQANSAVMNEQKTSSLDYRVVWPDGTVRWVWATPGESVTDENGKIIMLTGIVQDITERRQAEEQIRASEERYRGLFEYSPISIWEEDFSALITEIHRLQSEGEADFRAYLDQNPQAVLELAGLVRILDVNQTTAQLFGYARKEDLVPYLPNYFSEESLPIFREELIALAEGKTTFQAEIPVRTTNGQRMVLAMSLLVVPGYEEDYSKVLASFIDVTKHRQAEEEIQQHNRNLETIREILSSLPVQLDLGAIMDRSLGGALNLTGLERGALFLIDGQQNVTLAAEENIPANIDAAFQKEPDAFKERVCRKVIRTGQPVIHWGDLPPEQSPEAWQEPDWIRMLNVRFYAALPLLIKRRCIGVLCIFSTSDRQPSRHSVDLLNNLCGPFALAIENAQLYEKTRRDAARAEALMRTAARLNNSLDLRAVVKTVCEEAALALSVPAARLLAFDERSSMLLMVAGYGLPAGYEENFEGIPLEHYRRLPTDRGLVPQIWDLWEHPELPNAALHKKLHMRSVVTVSVERESRLIGALSVFTLEEMRVFTTDEVTLLQGLADQAAQAIENARLFEQVSAGRMHLRTLSKQLVEVQEAERRTLALELHDELGQMLNSIKMSLDMMPMLSPKVAHEQLVRAQSLVSDLVVRVRRMSLELRPSMLDDMGLLPALRWLFKNYHAQTEENVAFEHSNIEQRFNPQVEITAYRITQEALTNVIRHANSKRVHVEIWADEQALNLQIVDYGQGFDYAQVASQHASSGLSGMRERARLIGGELVVESEPGVGTTLTARLPFQSNG